MKRNIQLALLFLSMILIFCFTNVSGQNKSNMMYGNTPDTLFPYNNFQKAYKYHFTEPMEFYGAGREKPLPKDLKEVRIGFLGPLEGSYIISYGKQMLQGATMAIEEANKKGGYKGIPYKLMVHNDVGLWGAAANEIVKMDDEGVWAWLGSIDDIVSHVAIRVTLKLEIPMISPGDPDPTFTETNIPWVARCISDDRQSGYALVDYVHKKMKHKRVAVIRANNRYGRVGIMEFRDAAQRLGFPIIIETRFNDGEEDFKKQIESIKKTKPDAVVMWGNPKEMGLILNQMREMGIKQPVYCSDRAVSQEFLKIAGKNAENIVSTCQYNPESKDPKYQSFKSNYIKRFKMEPDVFAAHAYDGMNIIIESLQKAGPNRALIRDEMTNMMTYKGYKGVTGDIVFDATWNDVGLIYFAEVKNGKFIFYPTSELKYDK